VSFQVWGPHNRHHPVCSMPRCTPRNDCF